MASQDGQDLDLFSLETVDLSKRPPKGTYALYFNSPRSLEAFNRTGIAPTELNPVNRDKLIAALTDREHGKRVPMEIIKIRIHAAEMKREKKLSLLKETRH